MILALHDNFIKNGGGDKHAKWIEKLNGMFSFALWDANRKELILARDPLGIKPLIRCNVGGSLLFASEIKAILEHPDYKIDVDLKALNEYGREWKKVAKKIKTRSSAQIRSHAQKYFQKLSKERKAGLHGGAAALHGSHVVLGKSNKKKASNTEIRL